MTSEIALWGTIFWRLGGFVSIVAFSAAFLQCPVAKASDTSTTMTRMACVPSFLPMISLDPTCFLLALQGGRNPGKARVLDAPFPQILCTAPSAG